jgi:AcrR family transcriptional regulator
VDEIAQEARFSKGAVYWHFAGKEDLFFALLDERVDRPVRETIELLESAPPERDMAPEASRQFVELLRGQRDLMLLEHEYRSLALRDPDLRAVYAKRQAELRDALARALAARASHLGAPPLGMPVEEVATAFLALAHGLALEKLMDPDAVPDHLLGEMFALVYAGLVARAQPSGAEEGAAS